MEEAGRFERGVVPGPADDEEAGVPRSRERRARVGEPPAPAPQTADAVRKRQEKIAGMPADGAASAQAQE